jgi:3-methylcrotonyl-CoA carboxylase beta subunit
LRLLPDPVASKASHDASPARDPRDVYQLVTADGRGEYDVRDLLDCIIDAGSLEEFRADYAQTLVTGYAKLNGRPAGIIANQRCRTKTSQGELQIGGVLYGDASLKAARFD